MRFLQIPAFLYLATFPAVACGPWFPDTVLDEPQGALAVPPVSFEDELATLFGMPHAPVKAGDGSDAFHGESRLTTQIPLECAELEAILEIPGTGGMLRSRDRSRRYAALRESQLACVQSLGFNAGDIVTSPPAAEPPSRPLADIVPPDVADYLEAVRLMTLGQQGRSPRPVAAIAGAPARGTPPALRMGGMDAGQNIGG